MNMKHTAGPWIARQISDGFRITQNTNGTYVASIISREGWSKDTEANAKLIAAAPTMFEMLVEFANQTNPDVRKFQQDSLDLLTKITS